ncbi:MAG TPA: tetratricopeptide repeat protein [Chryseolinea sp.]
MKTTILFLALAIGQLTITKLSAQPVEDAEDQTEDQLAFDKAFALYDSGIYEQAVLAFSDFVERFPKSSLRGRAHFNVAYLYHELHYNAKAAAVFKEILNEGYHENDENSLMEPYALYKHNSCRHLAEIYLEEKDFTQAEMYMEMFDKEYPYQHFCGNEWAAYDLYKATMYARLYEGKGQHERAVRNLVPYIFDNGLASNAHLLHELVLILRAHYTTEEVQAELQRSLTTLSMHAKKGDVQARLILFGEKVNILPNYFVPDVDFNSLDGYKVVINENELFKTFLKE